MLEVVAGILINSEKKILISFRPRHVIQGNLWEFPGGKIEPGESAYQALVRELKEEIDVDVLSARPFMSLEYNYPEHSVVLDVWWVDEFSGEPHGKEGQIVRWAATTELLDLPFPEGNKPVIRNLMQMGSDLTPSLKHTTS